MALPLTILQTLSAPREHSAQTLLLLCVPKVNTKKFGECTFSFAALTIYSSLPLKLRQSPCLDSFESNLKTDLFELAYDLT